MDVRSPWAICRLPPESAGLPQSGTSTTRDINLGEKQTGKPIAGNRHDGFEEAGAGNQLTVELVRHSQRKRGATDRPDLRSMAPVLDPTDPLTRRKEQKEATICGWLQYNLRRTSDQSWGELGGKR